MGSNASHGKFSDDLSTYDSPCSCAHFEISWTGSRGIADKEDTSVPNNHHAQGKNTLMNQPAIASGAESNEIFVTYPETEVNVEAKSLPNLMENSTSGLIGGINESSLVIDYITEAGFHISQAVECEANSQFEQAFLSYKTAISFLLNGLQGKTPPYI